MRFPSWGSGRKGDSASLRVGEPGGALRSMDAYKKVVAQLDDDRGSSGSPGRIRTYDTLINSQLRYHCATGECVCARSKYTDARPERKGEFWISSQARRSRRSSRHARPSPPAPVSRRYARDAIRGHLRRTIGRVHSCIISKLRTILIRRSEACEKSVKVSTVYTTVYTTCSWVGVCCVEALECAHAPARQNVRNTGRKFART